VPPNFACRLSDAVDAERHGLAVEQWTSSTRPSTSAPRNDCLPLGQNRCGNLAEGETTAKGNDSIDVAEGLERRRLTNFKKRGRHDPVGSDSREEATATADWSSRRSGNKRHQRTLPVVAAVPSRRRKGSAGSVLPGRFSRRIVESVPLSRRHKRLM
jgi:hypothetical protein